MKKRINAAGMAVFMAFGCGTAVFGADMTIQNINKAISSVEDTEGQIDIESADENKVIFNIDNFRYVYLFDGVDDQILEVHVIDTDHEFDEDDHDVYYIDDEYEYVDYEYDSSIDYDSLISSLDALDIACEELELDDDENIVAKTVGLVWAEENGDLIYDVRILTDKGEEHEYELEAYTGNIYERQNYATSTVTRGRSTQSRYFYGLENGKYRKYKYEQPVVVVVTVKEEPPKEEPPKEEPPKEEIPKEELPKEEQAVKPQPDSGELPIIPEGEPQPEPQKPLAEPSSEITTAEPPEEIPTGEAPEIPDIEAPETTTAESVTAEPSTEAAEPATEVTTAEPVTAEPATEATTVERVTVEPATVERVTVERVTVEPATEATTVERVTVEKATEATTQAPVKVVERETQKAAEKTTEKAVQKTTERTTQRVIERPTETTTSVQNRVNNQPQMNRNNQNDMFGQNNRPFGGR